MLINTFRKPMAIVLIAVPGLIVRCSEPEIEPIPSTPVPFMPLSVGNTWDYQSTNYSPNDAQWVRIDTITTVVLEMMDITVQDEKYSVFVMQNFYDIPSLSSNANWLLWADDDGLYLIGGKILNKVYQHKTLLVQYPYSLGSAWSDSAIYYMYDSPGSEYGVFAADGSYETTCSATEVPIDVPAGEFMCDILQYKRRMVDDVAEEFDFYDYYASGVGLVRREIKDAEFLIRKIDLLNSNVK
jgi:hypothetical protein